MHVNFIPFPHHWTISLAKHSPMIAERNEATNLDDGSPILS